MACWHKFGNWQDAERNPQIDTAVAAGRYPFYVERIVQTKRCEKCNLVRSRKG